MNRKPDYTETKDGRVILRGPLYQRMRRLLCAIAKNRCENCGKYTPLDAGQVHHLNKRGGGKRDDRIFTPDEQAVCTRNLAWNCKSCHRGIHEGPKPVPAKPQFTEDEFKKLLGV